METIVMVNYCLKCSSWKNLRTMESPLNPIDKIFSLQQCQCGEWMEQMEFAANKNISAENISAMIKIITK